MTIFLEWGAFCMTEKNVYVAGTWDLFHPGHVNILRESKKLGRVIVAVSTDELIEHVKGERPTMCLDERIEVLNACKYVDCVVIQEKILDIKQLKEMKVDIIVVGTDWVNKKNDGIDWLKENDGCIVYLPYTKGVSTTEIRERIRNGAKTINQRN